MRLWVWVLLAILTITGLSGCLGEDPPDERQETPPGLRPPAHPDPLAAGGHAVHAHDYEIGTVGVGGAGPDHADYAYDSEVRGRVWVPDGDGPFPLAVFLHGQHPTCHTAGVKSGGRGVAPPDGCEGDTVFEPYPNHLGYAYLAEHLASHGVIVASILNKEINEQNGNPDVGMWARGEIVLATLDALTDGRVAVTADLVDANRVGLMGHSRGGEGVLTAAHVNAARDAADRHSLKGIVGVAPTDWNGRGVGDVPYLAIVPYCDGDVFDLRGLRAYDHSRFLDTPGHEVAKVQLLVMGANHNFYNTMWATEPAPHVYQGDDAGMWAHMNRECLLPVELGGGRIGADDVKTHAILHVNGFLRWTLLDETGMAAYFDGSTPLPGAACPGGSGPCAGAVLPTSLLAHRTLLWNTTGNGFETGPGAGALPELEGFTRTDHCDSCGDNVYNAAGSVDLEWEASATLRLSLQQGILSPEHVIALRIGVPTEHAGYVPDNPVDFTISVQDAHGEESITVASKHTAAATRAPPGQEIYAGGMAAGSAKVSLNMVRIPVDAFQAIDPGSATVLELRFDQSPGRILLAEAWIQFEAEKAHR